MYKVRGWFSEESAKLFALLLTIQRNHELNGDILEFGVYHGKSAILLGYFLYSNDKLVVNDIFESQHLNISLSGGTYHPPSIDKFTSNYKKFHANISNLTIYSCSSDQIKNVDVNPRFIHIDAGHSFEELRTDLLNSIALATRTNFSYSIIVIDDVFNKDFPEVHISMYETLKLSDIFVPLLVSKDKFVLCQSSMYEFYINEIKKHSEYFNLNYKMIKYLHAYIIKIDLKKKDYFRKLSKFLPEILKSSALSLKIKSLLNYNS
jgi:hypothetical protein